MYVKTLKEKIHLIEEKLQYSFQNPDYLVEAFIHPSFKNEWKDEKLNDNERLEFLGDAVLNVVVSHLLFTHFPNEPEGQLSKKKAHIVSRASCAKFMKNLGLQEFLLLGRGEMIQGARSEESQAANLFEAIIGALFLDGSLQAAERFISPLILNNLEELISTSDLNWKAKLQEKCAQNKYPLPVYSLIQEEGPGHEKIFEIALLIGSQEISRGSGRTKKSAEQLAAERACTMLEKGEVHI